MSSCCGRRHARDLDLDTNAVSWPCVVDSEFLATGTRCGMHSRRRHRSNSINPECGATQRTNQNHLVHSLANGRKWPNIAPIQGRWRRRIHGKSFESVRIQSTDGVSKHECMISYREYTSMRRLDAGITGFCPLRFRRIQR